MVPTSPQTMEQVFLCPWCSLKTALSISSQSCFLKDFSCMSSSQPGANIKPLPPMLPSKVRGGFGTHTQEKEGSPAWLALCPQAESCSLGRSNCRSNWRCIFPSSAVAVHTPEQHLAKAWRLRTGNTVQENWFWRTGQVIYTTKVPVNKTRPLEEHRTLGFFYYSFKNVPLGMVQHGVTWQHTFPSHIIFSQKEHLALLPL